MDMTFEEYVAAVNALAARDGCTEPGRSYCEAEAWRGCYEDGLTPEDAWSEERYAASTMGS